MIRRGAVDRLEAIQREALERLQSSDSDRERELLGQIVETACLLELAKVDTARVDAVGYAQQCVDVVTEMYPTSGAAIEARLRDPGDAKAGATRAGASAIVIEVSSGIRPGPPDAHAAELTVDGNGVGELAIGPTLAVLDADGFATTAAAQVSAGLDACVEAETQRRGVAAAAAMRIASELSEADPAGSLEAVAGHLAALAGTSAAELIIEHPVIGAPLTARNGVVPPSAVPASATRELEGGLLVVRRYGDAPVSAENDAIVAAVLEQLDVTLARLAKIARLEREVETDPLTGLGNRRRLDRVLNAALLRAGRYGERVGVLVFDLDGFKRVNDRLGHDVGDLVLRACARAMQDCTHGYDEVIRHGGDEILVVSPGSDAVAARDLAERVRAALPEAAATVLPPDLDISVSVGVATFPDAAIDAQSLLKAADDALYVAKRAGRDTVAMAPPMSAAESAPRREIATRDRERRRFKRRRQNT
jgi:diguanylate cyclase (GGDEF)-like protein